MQTTAEAFGLQFSALNIGYSSRMEKLNLLTSALYTLQTAIQKENEAETLATGNPALTAEGAWDTFRGNGVSPSPTGINVDVQTKAAALFTVIDAI
jgi:hypothetical protein